MKTAFLIFCRSVGLYAMITLPILFIPAFYFMSLGAVLVFGWIAWALFTLLYMIIVRFSIPYLLKMLLLLFAVGISVAAAYCIGVITINGNAEWHPECSLFLFIAAMSGCVSVIMSRDKIWKSCTSKRREAIYFKN